MRLIFTLLILVGSFSVFAQERTISGRLTGNDNTPLPGVNIVIKGTNAGTVTDADGYYSLKAPIGSTLVFSFVGMQTREVLVTETNLQPVKYTTDKHGKRTRKVMPRSIPFSLYKDSAVHQAPGVAVLTEKTPTYNSGTSVNPATIRSIKRSGNKYIIKTDEEMRRSGFGLQITSFTGIEKINKLPALQHAYAQGQPVGGSLTWRGPDQQEIFSWGPLVRTLEYDGTPYPYDNNGKLVTSGTGNLKPARKYDALKFFRTGITFANEVTLTLPTRRNGTLIIDLENRNKKGIIPNSDYHRLNFSVNLKNYKLAKNTTLNASAFYNQSSGNLLTRGANLSWITGSVLRSPITFDNANTFSPKVAASSPGAYRLPDGTIRSHAPGATDNPFGLSNELPDHEKLQRVIASFNLRYFPEGTFDLTINGNADYQWNTFSFGIPKGYSGSAGGQLTDRKDDQVINNIIVTPGYELSLPDGEIKFNASYQNQYTQRQLDRTDYVVLNPGTTDETDLKIQYGRNLSRMSHEVTAGFTYQHMDWLYAKLSTRHYFSNSVQQNRFTNFFPSAGLTVHINELFHIWSVNYLKAYATISRSIREAPLLYSNWSHLSTRMPLENYNSFYESQELQFNTALLPETERKFETGLKFMNGNGQLSIEVLYFNNHTTEFIAPVWSNDRFVLQNAADIKNYGSTIATGYSNYSGAVDWNTELRWSKYRNVTLQVYGADLIPLAGFQTVQSVLAPGKPVGAIYGTSYKRDASGQMLIDGDGFPIENTDLVMIGNPIPDWTLGWSAHLHVKRFDFSFLFDIKKGGDVWNGTHAILDYLGRSSTTGSQRNTSNFIYDGVDSNGNPNIIPVSFADPDKPLSENKWVRYGIDGVGERYVEDASWIRLSELTLSYLVVTNLSHRIRQVKLSLIGKNLFLYTPYTGVDPSSSLFNYSNGNGLDVFNTPATRSYNVQLTIKI